MDILQQLYDSEINFSLSCFWDGGFDTVLGDRINGIKSEITADTIAEALEWLKQKAIEFYPYSEFAEAMQGDLQ
jgi:hypothetical protein